MRKECQIEGCSKHVKGHGLCDTHYMRKRKGVPLDTPIRVRMAWTCTAEGCDRKGCAGGYCTMHYQRFMKQVPFAQPKKIDMPGQLCKVQDCNISVRNGGKGYCPRHKKQAMYEIRMSYLVNLLGDRCVDCGLSFPLAIYDFHHRDSKAKLFAISRCIDLSFDKVIAEALKCDLLCANCHRIRHSQEREWTSNPSFNEPQDLTLSVQ